MGDAGVKHCQQGLTDSCHIMCKTVGRAMLDKPQDKEIKTGISSHFEMCDLRFWAPCVIIMIALLML